MKPRAALTLLDLHQLYRQYVPVASRHPNARRARPNSWWPAHELGHLLTVPRRLIGEPMFGLDDYRAWELCATYELAAMSISRRLLVATGRPDLVAQEVSYTDDTVFTFGSYRRTRTILRRARCLRLPRTREGLERRLREVVA